MHRVEITESARRDIDEILMYIVGRSRKNAELVAERLEASLAGLSQFPERFAVVQRSPRWSRPVRSMIVSGYKVYFEIAGRDVYVLRVIRAARRAPRFKEGDR